MTNTPNQPIPSDKQFPLLGHLLKLRAAGDIQPYLTSLHKRRGDTVRFRLGPRQWFVSTRDPVLLDQVSESNFDERPQLLRRFMGWLGDGNIAFMTGAESHRTRAQLRTILTGDVLPQICEVGAAIIDQDESDWPDDKPLDIQNILTGIALRIMGACCFNGDFGPQAAGTRIGEAFLEVLHSSPLDFGALMTPVWRPEWWRWRDKVRRLHLLVDALLFAHNTAVDTNDLVTHLLSAKNEQGELFFDAESARMAVLAFFFGGVDATAIASTWTCALLAHNPESQAKVFKELTHVLDGRHISYTDLPNLPFLTACVEETLRIMPPNPLNMRQISTRQPMGPYSIDPGTIFLVNSMAIHHNPELWPQPGHFRPDRFLGDKPRAHRYAFIPFGVGPKSCLGPIFAMTETSMLVGNIVQKRRLEAPTGQTLETKLSSGVLFPATSLHLTAHRR